MATRVLAPAVSIDPSLTPFNKERAITGRCLAGGGTKAGTWALAMTSVTLHGDEDSAGPGVSGTFELFHADADGRFVTTAPPPPNGLATNYRSVGSEVSLDLQEPVLFDFDGDGSDEIVVYGSGGFHEGEGFSFGGVWTYRDGVISPYKPATGIAFEEVKDVTGDGRPDLLFHGAFDTVVESPCSGFGYRMTGPLFVATSHADGSFSTTDDAARAAILARCKAPPKTLVVLQEDDKDHIDERQTFENVACARVWGIPQARLREGITRGCRTLKAKRECDVKANECPQQADLLDWAGRTPPITLGRVPQR